MTEPTAQPLFELRTSAGCMPAGRARFAPWTQSISQIDPGEFLVVAGPSGSGKTTLLQLLGALDRPTRGEILFEGRDLAVLPDAELTELRLEDDRVRLSAVQPDPDPDCASKRRGRARSSGLPGSEREQRANELLDAVGLGPRGAHLPSELSGGEQQRVAIARALANRPRILLADEPTGNLDSATREEIVRLLRSISDQQGQSVILITHDASVAARAGRVVRMKDGRLLLPTPIAV